MNYDKDFIKNKLTLDQIFDLLVEFGGEPKKIKESRTIISRTICHHHPHSGSRKLYYRDDLKSFTCFTDCGCSFDVFDLVAKVKNLSGEFKQGRTREGQYYRREWKWNDSIQFLGAKFNIIGEQICIFDIANIEDFDVIQNHKEVERECNKITELAPIVIYNDNIIKNLPFSYFETWEQEGISKAVLKLFDIKYNPVDNALVIPHYDDMFRLIGIRIRNMSPDRIELFGKYRPARFLGIDFVHSLSLNLYGLCFSKLNIKRMKKAIVFEGEKSPMLYTAIFGIENNISVAVCGSSLKQRQFELLIEAGAEEIIIAFDKQFKKVGDKEYWRWIENLKKMYLKYSNYCNFTFIFDKTGTVLNYKSSPIDEGKEKFELLFKERSSLHRLFFGKGSRQ